MLISAFISALFTLSFHCIRKDYHDLASKPLMIAETAIWLICLTCVLLFMKFFGG